MNDFLPTHDTEAITGHGRLSEGDYGAQEPDAHRMAERTYLGILLQWRPGYAKPEVIVPDEWLSGFGVAARNAIRGFKPWPLFPSLALVAALRESYVPEKVVDEVHEYAVVSKARDWASVDEAAEQLRDAHRTRVRDAARRDRLSIIRKMAQNASDRDKIVSLCSELLQVSLNGPPMV